MIDMPKYGGTVGFGEVVHPRTGHVGRIGFCNACGWRGLPTFIKRVAQTFCPVCQELPHSSPGTRDRGGKSKRKAAKAARKRNR